MSSEKWSPRTGLNRRQPVYKTGALPTELQGQKCKMVEVEGFAPSSSETFLAITTGLVLCYTDEHITIRQRSLFKTVDLNVLQS
jgi:hypothetical protein